MLISMINLTVATKRKSNIFYSLCSCPKVQVISCGSAFNANDMDINVMAKNCHIPPVQERAKARVIKKSLSLNLQRSVTPIKSP